MVAKTYGFYARKGMESVLWIMGYGTTALAFPCRLRTNLVN